MPELLSPRQFAQAIGVSESSVRRWADGGQIRITRTAGGHRKIARTEAIRFIREKSAVVVRPELLEIREPQQRRRRTEAFASQHEELLQALEQGQADVVAGLLTSMYLNGVSAAEICDGPLQYAMQRIGQMWPTDPRAILVEHRATNICIEALSRLHAHFAEPSEAKMIAVGGAPENDPYVLPSLMATTVLRDAGIEAVNLGPCTPLEVLSCSAVEMGARMVWIALTSPLPKSAVDQALSELALCLAKKRIHVVLGGRASSRYRIPDVEFVHAFSSMAEMRGFTKGLLASGQNRSKKSGTAMRKSRRRTQLEA